jgi:YD repeat-containing protein
MRVFVAIKNNINLICVALFLTYFQPVYADYPATYQYVTGGDVHNSLANRPQSSCQNYATNVTPFTSYFITYISNTQTTCTLYYVNKPQFGPGAQTVTHAITAIYPSCNTGNLDISVYPAICRITCVLPKVFNINTKSCVNPPDNPKSTGFSCPATPASKNSISFNAGNEFISEQDYITSAYIAPNFIRTYNSTAAASSSSSGKRWSNELNRSVINSIDYSYVYRPDGKVYTFNKVGSAWLVDADVTDRLLELKDANNIRTGWQYIVASDSSTETYNVDGHLISVSDKAGNSVSYTLSDANTPTTIAFNPNLPIVMTDHLGRSLHFTYDSFDRIATMTNPEGGAYQYTYNTNNNLASVTYPDEKVKTYHYGEAVNVSATPESGIDNNALLTGVTDENGDRYATYRYDAKGRAYDEELAPDLNLPAKIGHNNLVYNVDASGNPTTTVVTDGRNTTRTYNFTTILGVVKSTGTDQPAGSGCAASGSNITYDANGNIDTKTDFNGHQTKYHYDMSRNLETTRVEGLDNTGNVQAETRTITTQWHSTWRLPEVVSEYSGGADNNGLPLGTLLRQTTTAYDDKGNITSISVNDPINNKTRTVTTTYTYSTAVPGLVLTKVVDGPRTDVNDITTYNYYPHDETCTPSSATPLIDPITNTSPANLGCRGQLSSVSNALNQTTTYDRYNHHGQVEQMTDANGLVTTNTYDLRQRLRSTTVGTELTNYQYDDAGQLDILTLPDGSQLNYDYDAAHRLTDITDNLGNTIHYTLDAMGNRKQEDIKDPQGALTKTLSRSYDALNRLDKVTGIE